MKARITLCLLIVLAFLSAKAGDGPYAGGEGDGFAQAGLEWDVLSVGHFDVREAAVYPLPAKAGLEIFAPQATNMTVAVLHGVSGGQHGLLERTGGESWRLPQVPPGLYVIQWQGEQGQRYFSRLVIASF